MWIKLFQKDGTFVHECSIPAFALPPDVVFYARRLFVFDPKFTKNENHVTGYTEGSAWAVHVPEISQERRDALTLGPKLTPEQRQEFEQEIEAIWLRAQAEERGEAL